MSLRARLLLGMAAVAVVLVVASISINRATEHNLVTQLDQRLARSDELIGSVDLDGDSRTAPRPPSSVYIGVVDQSSQKLVTLYTPNENREAVDTAPDLTALEVQQHLGTGAFTVPAQQSSTRYRAIVRPEGSSGQAVVLALPMTDVDQAIARLITIQTTASVAILATLGLVTFWVLRLGVRPVRQMTEVAAAIGEGDLSQRIPDSAPGTEAGELAVALNHMLGRIEDAFADQARSEAKLRQFVADASHELRTPVTTIRGYAELYRLGGLEDDHALDEAMRRTEQEATRMGQLVGDLLDLARLDEGRPLHRREIDLTDLAADAVADARAVEPDRPITLDAPRPEVVVADEALIRQILANLLANVRVHTDPGTPVAVEVRGEPTQVRVQVADQGPGMSEEAAAHAFERFYRADKARTRHRGGSGLGLSIVAATVEAHGGTVGVDSAPGRGTKIWFRLPRIPAE